MSKELSAEIDLSEFSDHAQQRTNSYTKMREIRKCTELSKKAKKAGVKEGHLYYFDPNEDEPEYRDLGKKTELIPLKRTMRLEFFNSAEQRQEFVSSEFTHMFCPIALYGYPNDDNQELLELQPYLRGKNDEGIKMMDLKNNEYSSLRMKYYVYCLWKDEDAETMRLVKVPISATDNTGCKSKEFSPRGFDDPAEDSMCGLVEKVKAATKSEEYLFAFRITLEIKEAHESFYATFSVKNPVEKEHSDKVKEALEFLKLTLETGTSYKLSKRFADTVDKEKFDPQMIEYLVNNPAVMLGTERFDQKQLEGSAKASTSIPEKAASVEEVAEALGGEEEAKPKVTYANEEKPGDLTKKMMEGKPKAEDLPF